MFVSVVHSSDINIPPKDVVKAWIEINLIFVDVFKQLVGTKHLGNAHQLSITHNSVVTFICTGRCHISRSVGRSVSPSVR